MVQAQTKTTSVKTEVAIKKEAPLPAMFDLESASGQGSEFITARDTKLPILKKSKPLKSSIARLSFSLKSSVKTKSSSRMM